MKKFTATMPKFKLPAEAGVGVETRGGADIPSGEKETPGRLPALPDTVKVAGHGKTKIGATSRIAGPGTITKGFA